MRINDGQSPLREHVTTTQIAAETIAGLGDYELGGEDAWWDTGWRRPRRIGDRDVGGPVPVTWKAEPAVYDYRQVRRTPLAQ